LLTRIEWLYTFDNFGVCDEIVEELLPAFGGQACIFYHVGELVETVWGERIDRVFLSGVGGDSRAAIAIAAVARLLILPEMVIHLGVEHMFGQGFLQRIQQAALLQGRSSIAASQKLI
jgi:hypothetical protein